MHDQGEVVTQNAHELQKHVIKSDVSPVLKSLFNRVNSMKGQKQSDSVRALAVAEIYLSNDESLILELEDYLDGLSPLEVHHLRNSNVIIALGIELPSGTINPKGQC